MTDNHDPYDLSAWGPLEDQPIDAAALGQKARDLREATSQSAENVAKKAGLATSRVLHFEETGEISLAGFVAVHKALSGNAPLHELLDSPHFSTIDEVTAWAQRRRKFLRKQRSPR